MKRMSDEEKGLAMMSAFYHTPMNKLGLNASWMYFGEAQHGLIRACASLLVPTLHA